MINLFRKREVQKDNFSLYSPVDGECIDITEVDDEAFSSKMLGEGFAVRPTSFTVCSPCNGEITMLFPAGHAFGIKMFDGKEIIVHIGIDAAEANGRGFKVLKMLGDIVKIGDPVVKVNNQELKEYDLTTMVVVTNTRENFHNEKVGQLVFCKDLIIPQKD